MGYSSCANEEEKVFPILKVNVKKERERELWLQRKMDNEAALAPPGILELQETKVHTLHILSMLEFYEKFLNHSHHFTT